MIASPAILPWSLVKTGERLRPVECSTRFVWQTNWRTHSHTDKLMIFIIWPMLLMHWTDNKRCVCVRACVWNAETWSSSGSTRLVCLTTLSPRRRWTACSLLSALTVQLVRGRHQVKRHRCSCVHSWSAALPSHCHLPVCSCLNYWRTSKNSSSSSSRRQWRSPVELQTRTHKH